MDALALRMYFSPPYQVDESLPTLKRIVKAIGPYRGASLVPEINSELLQERRNQSYETGFASLMLIHPKLDDKGRWSVNISQSHESDCATVFVIAPLRPPDRSGFVTAWDFQLAAAPRVIKAAKPSFALLNWKFPNGRIEPGELPMVTPWTYLGPQVVSKMGRKALDKLPDCVREDLGDGVVLRPVPDFFSKPSKAFLDALKKLSGGKTEYNQSRPPR